MKNVLFVLFLLYVITFCLARLTNPQWFTGPQEPVGFLWLLPLAIPVLAAFYFGPAFLLALLVSRFIKKPITLPGAGALFAAGALTSCTFTGHYPVPVVFGFLDVPAYWPRMIIPMVSTGGLVVLVFGWVSHRGRLARRNGSEQR